MASSSQGSQTSGSSSSPRHADTSDDPGQLSNDNMSTSFTFVLNDPSRPCQNAPEKPSHHDRFAHTRTKRKRTSPSDFAVLEREYDCEPRPDKNARMDIASRVSLNEKEVQIWFQNRRQMTRRKARTWQPNEISEIIRSSQHTYDSSPPSSQEQVSDTAPGTANSTADKPEMVAANKPAQGLFQITSPSTFRKEIQCIGERLREDGTQSQEEEAGEDYGEDKSPSVSASEPSPTVVSSDRPANAESSQQSDITIPDVGRKSLTRTNSNVRLRMSLDGKAELVLEKNSPSPPSKPNRRESWAGRSGLRRSQSAFNPCTSPSLEIGSSNVPASYHGLLSQPREIHRPLGRSRDARAWEFYCDADAQDALSIAAEHDSKGSAQAAINLIRSNSGLMGKRQPGSPLAPSLRKHNSFVGRTALEHDPERIEKGVAITKLSEKRKSLETLEGRTKLARTSSSVARLQTTNFMQKAPSTGTKPKNRRRGMLKDGELDIYQDGGDTDSDKENWQPGTRVSAPTHPRAHLAAGSRSVLGLNAREISHESSLGALMARKNAGNARVRKTGLGDSKNPELESNTGGPALIGGSVGKNANLADGEELDAVQNLLSLSQDGRW